MDDNPTPVSIRVATSDGTLHASAFISENAEYHTVVTTSARFRPTRSENQPPVVAPMNMPTKAADVMVPIVPSESCHSWRMPGAAKAKLFRSPSSKKKMYASSLTMSRWKPAIGRRSRRTAAGGRAGAVRAGIIAEVPSRRPRAPPSGTGRARTCRTVT